jgi:hypothetical protein
MCGRPRVAVKLLPRAGRTVDAFTRVAPPRFTIVITTLSRGWAAAPRTERLITMVHEWYHVVQFSLDRGCRCHPPAWLVEGSAVYESYRVVAERGLAGYQALRRREVSFARVDATPLASLTMKVPTASDYSVAFHAAELLGREGGARSLDRYWMLLGRTSSSSRAFRESFGMKLGRFYRLFARNRSLGFGG